VDETTLIPLQNPLLHYTLNTPYHYYAFDRLLKKENFDVIVAAHVLAGSAVIHAAKKHNVPVIFDLKDWFPDSAAAYFKNHFLQDAVRKSVWTITKRNLENCDIITTVSPSLVDKLRHFGISAELITNGVDTDFFKPLDGSSVRKELGISQEAFVIGFCGSIERWYALDEMIRAMPTLIRHRPDTRLLIVGGSLFTDYERELKELTETLGITGHVFFTGLKPYTELPRYIASMDACTIPLAPPQWGDIALPNKYFEYSACGKPIVMRPMPDVERIGGQNLFVYRTQDEYISHIRTLMDHPSTFPANTEKNSWNEKAKQFEELFNRIV
jgi:glycosyltransferase involved in cell wall biosynthesis